MKSLPEFTQAGPTRHNRLGRAVALLVSAISLILPMRRTLADGAAVTFELLASFDYPGSTSTQPYGINDGGDVAGFCYPPGDTTAGFVRYRDGTFSDLIVAPPGSDNNTYVFDINNSGTICGYFAGRSAAAFLISGSSYTEVNLPGDGDQLTGVNDMGDFCGHSLDPGFQSFVSIAGTLTSFKVPGSIYTDVEGINNLGQCVGNYQARNNHHFSFRRNPDGTLHYPIGDRDTFLHGINDHGEMVGLVDYAQGFRFHGIYFPSPNQSFTYDYPGADFTWFHGISNRRLICGTYFADGVYHGFIVRVRPAADE